MLDCRNCGVWILAIAGCLLAAGCVSPGNRPSHRATQSAHPAAPGVVDKNLVEAHAHYLQGLVDELNDRAEAGQGELAKAALNDPANTDLVLELTRSYLQQKHPEKALEILTRACAVRGASGVLFARLGLVYSQTGKDDLAVAAGETAIKRSPEAMDGYRTLFFLHLQQNNSQKALKVLERAGRSPNTTSGFSLELTDLYLTLQRQDPVDKKLIATNGRALLDRVAGDGPSDPRLLTKLADDYNELGDTTNAMKIYLRLVALQHDSPEARIKLHDKLAKIYLRQNDYTNGAAQLREIVQDDPANPEAYYLLGSLADDGKKPAEAEEYFRKVLLLSENFEQAYYDLARVQVDLNQPAKALATLEKAAKKFKVGFVAEVLTALAYDQQKDYTNATSHFTAAEIIGQATDPKRLNGGFYFNEGAAYERAGKFDQAEKCFEKSLALEPNSAEALNYLGYMLADRGVKLERARELIQKAVKLEPNSSAYLDSLGWVLYKLNRPQEALPQEQKAIQLSETPDPTLFEHLGDIYVLLKQTDKARDAYAKSLAAGPTEEVQKKLDAAGKPGT